MSRSPLLALFRHAYVYTITPLIQGFGMFSHRFQLEALITQHARQRMADRNIDEALLLDMTLKILNHWVL